MISLPFYCTLLFCSLGHLYSGASCQQNNSSFFEQNSDIFKEYVEHMVVYVLLWPLDNVVYTRESPHRDSYTCQNLVRQHTLLGFDAL